MESGVREKVRKWKRAIEKPGSGSVDEVFNEVAIMEAMGWSWEQIYNTPETIFLSTARILGLKGKKQYKDMEAAKHKRGGR